MPKVRPTVLTIGGFDPSAGAGVLADIKTFEQHKVYGFAVNTANTIQNESDFISVNWIEELLILNQLNVLLSLYKFEYIKIGLIPNFELIAKIHELLPTSKIIWDPILKASAGFDFKQNLSELNNALKCVYLITPNVEEIKILTQSNDAFEAAKKLTATTKVLLKGGHNESEPGKDFLFTDNNVFPFKPKVKNISQKHGSGCVFSSALTANLALGYPMIKSCLRAKAYTAKVLASNTTLLGYHK